MLHLLHDNNTTIMQNECGKWLLMLYVLNEDESQRVELDESQRVELHVHIVFSIFNVCLAITGPSA